MRYKGWMGILGVVVLSAGWLVSGSVHAQASDGYSLDDFKLRTANDLVDVCTIEPGHRDYETAVAFCYGFFEGAAHYDDVVAASSRAEIVCIPPQVTRTQAVAVFIAHNKANPQYGSEAPIDAIFRALIAKWPCAE